MALDDTCMQFITARLRSNIKLNLQVFYRLIEMWNH